MDLVCKYCSKISLSPNSDRNHQRLCKLNPDRKPTWLETISDEKRKELINNNKSKGLTRNQYTLARINGVDAPTLSKETRQKISNKTKAQSIAFWSDKNNRDRQSIKMQEVARNNPDIYSHKNMGRSKTFWEDGIRFDSSWEYRFYTWCKKNNIRCIRNKKPFTYIFEGKNKTYYPDFYLPEYDLYVEIKGYETDKDRAKWVSFPKTLRVIKDVSNLSISLLL